MAEFNYDYWQELYNETGKGIGDIDPYYKERGHEPGATELSNKMYWVQLKQAEIKKILAESIYENPILRGSALISAERTLKDVLIAEKSFRLIEEEERYGQLEDREIKSTMGSIAKVSSQSKSNERKIVGTRIFSKDAIEAGIDVIDSLVQEVSKNVDIKVNLASGENRESFISNEDKSKISVACSEVVKKYESILSSAKTLQEIKEIPQQISNIKQQELEASNEAAKARRERLEEYDFKKLKQENAAYRKQEKKTAGNTANWMKPGEYYTQKDTLGL